MILHKLWYLSDSRYILLILWIPSSRALYGRASSPLMLTGHSVVINIFTVAYSLIANREPKRLEWEISPLPGSVVAVSLELTRILKKNYHQTPPFRTYLNSATSGNVERWKRGHWSRQSLQILLTLASFIRGTSHQGKKNHLCSRNILILSCGKRGAPNYWRNAGS